MKPKKQTFTQAELFDNAQTVKAVNRPMRSGGSQNPIVFRDYDSFIAKFSENPRTTDECWTPQDVFEAVVDYVGTIYDMRGKEVLRPFYPGGDYENAEYPLNGVVIDNPPFSIFTKICRFYTFHRIPFFLFGPGLTISSVWKYCSTVIIGRGITFSNGANVRINFATNLLGDVLCQTAPDLDRRIKLLPSQNQKVELPSYAYPDEVISISNFQTIAHGGVFYSVHRDEAVIIKDLDRHPKASGLFCEHLLVAQAQAQAHAQAHAQAQRAIHIPLSMRERKIVEQLSKQNEK